MLSVHVSFSYSLNSLRTCWLLQLLLVLPKSTFRPSDGEVAHLASGQETRGVRDRAQSYPRFSTPHSWEGMQCGESQCSA